MRSSGSHPARAIVMTGVIVLAVSAAASAQTAKVRYEAAAEREARVRTQLADEASAAPSPGFFTQVAQAITSFESIVRRFPASGYADNALWQAASLADAVYQKYNRSDDRDRAVRFYRWLAQEYPASPFVKRANARVAVLRETSIAAVPVTDLATLIGIQRTVLPGSVRVTLELDREVTYYEERLFGPSRLFFDLKNVQLTPALLDKVLSYPSDIVNKIRVGRHPDNVVRVVLDFEDVAKYSVFTLYSPFRLVVDAERAAIRRTTTSTILPPEPQPVLPSLAPPALEAPRPVAAVAPPAPEPAPATPPAAAPAPLSTAAAPPPAALPAPAAPALNAAGGFSIARQLGLSVSRIVIDPGHGGHDPGVLGKGLTEAALVLDVALRLEKLLQKEPGVEVVLTRRTDTYLPLEERTEIANRQSADMFLSIHANASRNTAAKGVETFFLSFASSPDAEAVAARENSASAKDMHQLPDLIKKITLNNKLDESRDLANMVQDALIANLRRSNREIRSRGVKKAPFVVLIGAAMPSVLAEIAFVSNKQELSLLKTSAYKQKIAESLYNAVLKYRRSLKTQTTLTLPER